MWHSQLKGPTWPILISEIRPKREICLQKLKKMFVHILLRKGTLLQIKSVLMRDVPRTTRHGEDVFHLDASVTEIE